MTDAPASGRRRLTVTDPDAFAVHLEVEVCRLCEGEGQLAAGFGPARSGTPSVVDCPNCEGTGRGRRVVRAVFSVGQAAVDIVMSGSEFEAFVNAGIAALARLEKTEEGQ